MAKSYCDKHHRYIRTCENCKEIRREYVRAYYNQARDKEAARAKEWYRKNSKRVRDQMRTYKIRARVKALRIVVAGGLDKVLTSSGSARAREREREIMEHH